MTESRGVELMEQNGINTYLKDFWRRMRMMLTGKPLSTVLGTLSNQLKKPTVLSEFDWNHNSNLYTTVLSIHNIWDVGNRIFLILMDYSRGEKNGCFAVRKDLVKTCGVDAVRCGAMSWWSIPIFCSVKFWKERLERRGKTSRKTLKR